MDYSQWITTVIIFFPILACKEFTNCIWHLKYINLPELFYLNTFQSYFWTKHSKLYILCIALCSSEYQSMVLFSLIEKNRADRVINRIFFSSVEMFLNSHMFQDCCFGCRLLNLPVFHFFSLSSLWICPWGGNVSGTQVFFFVMILWLMIFGVDLWRLLQNWAYIKSSSSHCVQLWNVTFTK